MKIYCKIRFYSFTENKSILKVLWNFMTQKTKYKKVMKKMITILQNPNFHLEYLTFYSAVL